LERNLRQIPTRQPIQLQPEVKKEFDELHAELIVTLHNNEITQSSVISYLIRFYRENSQKKQV